MIGLVEKKDEKISELKLEMNHLNGRLKENITAVEKDEVSINILQSKLTF